MKWWYWLILELLIIFGVTAWIYFLPGEFKDDLAKGMIGFVLIYAITECKDKNRRKIMIENHTIEQNAGENQIEGGVVRISGSVSEKHFRPFNNCDELIEVFRKKCEAEVNCSTYFPTLYKACVWVKHKRYGTENLIIAFDNDNESIGGSCVFIQDFWVDMKELFDNFTFCDGSPCGLEE